MTVKSIVPSFLIIILFSIAACSPEKLPLSDEVLESQAEALAEQKIEEGKKIYESNCAGCHDSGVAGLVVVKKRSIEGYEGKTGVMPPKGGNSTLTDDEVKNAVDFMMVKLK